MTSNRWNAIVHDYDSAKAYIDRGRKKIFRTLYHKRLYATYRNDGASIGIHFKNWGPDLIRYLPNGLAIIALDRSFSYPSTRDVLVRYANLEGLVQRNHKLYLLQEGDTFTDTRKVPCPKCRGKGVHWYQCNGQKDNARNKNTNRFRYQEVRTFSGQTFTVYGCNCLQSNPNLNPNNHRAKIECRFCNGVGYRDLGGKRKAFQWDGDPLTIDLATGKILQVHKPKLLINIIKEKEGEKGDQ